MDVTSVQLEYFLHLFMTPLFFVNRRKGRGRSASTQQKETPLATRPQRRTRFLRGTGRDIEPDLEQDNDNEADNDPDLDQDVDDASSDEDIQSPRSIFQEINNKTPPPNFDKVYWVFSICRSNLICKQAF